MSYQYNNTSKTSIQINNPNVSIKGSLSSINEDREEDVVNYRISEKYKNNLVLVFVISFTVVIIVTGTVLFAAYN